MTAEVEKKLKKVLNCTKKSSDRVYFAASDLIDGIGKLGTRKKHRESALEALQEIALEAYEPLRSPAANELADLLTAEHENLLPFLREGLKNEEINYGCVRGLLNVLGEGAYGDIVPLILDPNGSLNSRSSALEAICEHSGQPFNEDLPLYEDMTTADLPMEQVRVWADAGFPQSIPVTVDVPIAALSKLGIELPDDYLEFLKKHRRSVTYDYADSTWELTTAANLLAKINVDGKSTVSVQQLQRYAAMLQASMETDATEDQKGKPYPLERLAAGTVIGTDDSGDLLYLDPTARHSVWIFHHDGGDVELAAKTFKAWLRKAVKEAD